jgi:hypothetical protein
MYKFMDLGKHIEEIRTGIKAGRFSNEASVSQGIILRLLHALAWPAYDIQIVSPEYSLQGRRVDFALCHPPGKPIAFIEVKQIGQSEGAERQLFEYAFHVGVPLAILTDGREWNFFLPGVQGDYGERRVYKLDIIERDIPECVNRLTRYLQYDAIASGTAIEAAREDYRNVSRNRQILATFPKAWIRLLEEEDELLLELLADQVESLCGFKPDLDSVAYFLKNNITFKSSILEVQKKSPKNSTNSISVPPKNAQSATSALKPLVTGFVLLGQQYSARNAIEVLEKVFEQLAKRDPTILERFAALPKHGRNRRYLAKQSNDLYPPKSQHLNSKSKQLTSGWWFSTNHSKAEIKKIIGMLCEVSHFKYDKDLVVMLPDREEKHINFDDLL